MGLPNLSGSNIQETYQRVLHTDGASIYDGTGSTLPIGYDGNTTTFTDNVEFQEGKFVTVAGSAKILFQADRTYFQDDIKIPDNVAFVLGTNSNHKMLVDSNDDFYITSGSIFSQTSWLRYKTSINTLNVYSDFYTQGNITASGDISSSNIVKASAIHVNGEHVLELTPDPTNAVLNIAKNNNITRINYGRDTSTEHHIHGNVTASGNISCSGNLMFDTIDGGTF